MSSPPTTPTIDTTPTTPSDSTFNFIDNNPIKHHKVSFTSFPNLSENVKHIDSDSDDGDDDGYDDNRSTVDLNELKRHHFDYVDVDEIDDTMDEFNELLEQLKMGIQQLQQSSENVNQSVNQNVPMASPRNICSDPHKLHRRLYKIYSTLYHAVYDCVNIQDGEDPVPYALLFEMHRDLLSASAGATGASEKEECVTPVADETHLFNDSIKDELNKIRKKHSFNQPPPSPTPLHSPQLQKRTSMYGDLKEKVVKRVNSASKLSHQRSNSSNEIIQSDIYQLKQSSARVLPEEEKNQFTRELDDLLQKYKLM